MIKRWVIPDIHGCLKTVRNLIENQIRPVPQDVFYFLGDYIDRGPDSKGVIDYLISLQEIGLKTNFLMGNHEEFLLKSVEQEPLSGNFFNLGKKNHYKESWLANGGEECLKSFGLINLNEIPQKYIDWINNLKKVIVLEDYILVHAGLNFDNEDPFSDTSAMLWARDFEIIPERINYRIIIHGHVPVNLDFIKTCIGNKHTRFIDLDNGIYMKDRIGFGNLTAYELGSKQLLVQENIDL